MMTQSEVETTRVAQTTLEIDASPDLVWRALTEPVEIARWFALSADVQPGVGGSVLWRWHDVWAWPSRIAIWEPLRHLRLTYAHDPATGLKTPAGDLPAPGHPLVIDFQLEARGSGTVLRLVHSGFGRDASWDHEYEGVRRGWVTELAALKHYVERHFGEKRRVVWVFVRTDLTAARVWARLVGGPSETGPIVQDGRDLAARGGPGGPVPIVVNSLDPDGHLIGEVPSWNDAQLRVWVDPAPEGAMAHVFISLYGDTRKIPNAPSPKGLTEVLGRTFPEHAGDLVVMDS